MRSNTLYSFTIIFALVFLGYWVAMDTYFVAEDFTHLRITSFTHADGPDRFRPVFYAIFALENALIGLNLFWRHFTAIFFHCMNGILLFILFKKMLNVQKNYVALFASLIFLLNPYWADGVTFIGNRYVIFAVTFILSSMLFYLKYLENKSVWFLFLTILSMYLGIGSNQFAFIIAPLLFSIDLYLLRKNESLLKRISFNRFGFGSILVSYIGILGWIKLRKGLLIGGGRPEYLLENFTELKEIGPFFGNVINTILKPISTLQTHPPIIHDLGGAVLVLWGFLLLYRLCLYAHNRKNFIWSVCFSLASIFPLVAMGLGYYSGSMAGGHFYYLGGTAMAFLTADIINVKARNEYLSFTLFRQFIAPIVIILFYFYLLLALNHGVWKKAGDLSLYTKETILSLSDQYAELTVKDYPTYYKDASVFGWPGAIVIALSPPFVDKKLDITILSDYDYIEGVLTFKGEYDTIEYLIKNPNAQTKDSAKIIWNKEKLVYEREM